MSASTLFAGSTPDASAIALLAFALPEPGTSNPRGFKWSRTWPPSGAATAVATSAATRNRHGWRSMRPASADSTNTDPGARRTQGPEIRRAANAGLGLEPGPGRELEVARDDRGAVRADEPHGERRAVASPARDPRRLFRDVAITPLHQREQRNPELASLRGEVVLEPLRTFAVADALEDPFLHQAVEAVRQDVTGDAEAREQLVEAVDLEDDVADHEESPTVADELECAADRAVLAFVFALAHAAERSDVTCMMQVIWCRVHCVKQSTATPLILALLGGLPFK